jgi:predicted O-methyltransferase YrrM
MIFIYKLSRQTNALNILEIGCATGVSGMILADSIGKTLVQNPESSGILTSIDPYQQTQWKSFGKHNIDNVILPYKRHGINLSHNLVEVTFDPALKQMIDNNIKYDMILIDGAHNYKDVLYDIKHSNKLIKNGGIIVLDDVRHYDVAKALNKFLITCNKWKRIAINKTIKYNVSKINKYNNPTTMFAYQVIA